MELGEFSPSAPSVKPSRHPPPSNQRFKNGKCISSQFNPQVLTVDSMLSPKVVFTRSEMSYDTTLGGKKLPVDLCIQHDLKYTQRRLE